MLEILKKRYPVLFFLLFFLIFFRKVFFSGLMPIPSDLLVSFYFPYSSGGFKEYTPWVGNKAQVSDDALRQQYPWKVFAASRLKKGELPLWNPYAFSGYPLLANVQTAVFYPFNWIFIFADPKFAWTFLIILQPVLASFFMYLFLRSLNLDKTSSIMGGLIFSLMSFEMFWMEQMIIGHTTLWLPLILLAIQKISQNRRSWFLVGLFGLVMSVFAGYSQTTLYVFIISFFFAVMKIITAENRRQQISLIAPYFLLFFLSLGVTSVQLLPTLEIYRYSAREGQFSRNLFSGWLATPRSVLTLLYADIFGNMSTHNFWGDQYADFNHYFGTIPLLLLLTGLFLAYKKKLSLNEGGWFLILGLVFWLFALPTPFGFIPVLLKIPILSTGVPARFLFIFQFSMAVATAFALELLLREKEKKFSVRPAISLIIFSFLLLLLFYPETKILTNIYTAKNLAVGVRNLIFTAALLSAGTFILLALRIFYRQKFLYWFLIILTAFEFMYLGNKYLPMAKKEYLFPEHPLFTFLQNQTGIDRVWGQNTTYLTTNFPTYYKLPYSDGYDSLYIKRYGELVYAARDGKIPDDLPRSDVNLSPNKEDWKYKERMLDILGIKYVLDKNDAPKLNFEPESWRFPENRYRLIWQNGKFKVYENKKAWPRIYFARDLRNITGRQEIVDYLLKSPDSQIAVVEENLPVNIGPAGGNIIKNLAYAPNKIFLETAGDSDGFLVLSDNYFPGWKAFIDNRPVKIYRTNYTFRGIIVPSGIHQIRFRYEPDSLRYGFYLTVIFIVITFTYFYFFRRHEETSS